MMRQRCFLTLAILCFLLRPTSVRAQASVQVLMGSDTSRSHLISRYLYGQFAEHLGRCIYDGFWVADSLKVPKQGRIRMDVAEALKRIKVPVLRWPGGCFADQYHWQDGIGPRNERPSRINNPWGKIVEDNSFGTHEFLELCDLIGCEPYIAGNVGSGTPREMADWIEYLNYDGPTALTQLRGRNGRTRPWNVHFWGIGNESWGCGGLMTPEYYADQYKKYAVFCNDYQDTKLKKIMSGNNLEWTDILMTKIPLSFIWGMSIHYYAIPGDWTHKGPSANFDEQEYFRAIRSALGIESFIDKQSAAMDKYDPEKKVGIVMDEWGIWTDVEPGTNPDFLYQQNSLRDALIAGATLNIFNNHCDRVKMANLAQTVNVLQALILTNREKMLLTPTYYVFDMYKVHQDATLIPLKFYSPDYAFGQDKVPAINISASRDSSQAVHISLVNMDPVKKVTVSFPAGELPPGPIDGQILTSGKFSDINTFERPDKVKIRPFGEVKKVSGNLTVTLPPCSIVMLTIR